MAPHAIAMRCPTAGRLVDAFRLADADPATAWRAVAIRAFGGWIAAIGLMMVGFAFAS